MPLPSATSEDLGFHHQIRGAELLSNLLGLLFGCGYPKTGHSNPLLLQQGVADIFMDIEMASLVQLRSCFGVGSAGSQNLIKGTRKSKTFVVIVAIRWPLERWAL